MSDRPEFRTDLYRGTARYYDEFRLRYPAELIDDLCRRVSTTGKGRLLDLACGPGTATFALCDQFAEVWAVDLEPETVDFAARKAEDLGVGNVRWMTGRAEDIDPEETFDVVTIGTAFHRLDRRRVAGLAVQWLRAGGHLALLWSGTPIIGDGTEWQQVLTAVVVDWMKRAQTEDNVPADLAEHIARTPHTTVLEEAGFAPVERREFTEVHDWTVAELIGFVYSTSLLPRSVLGDRTDAFEREVEEQLVAVEPSGVFREQASFAYDLAYRAP